MVDWLVSDRPTPYPDAVAAMEAHVAEMLAGAADERIWLLEHPACYTAGTSARAADLLAPDRLPVYPTRRGGEYTYHGPGQRVVYTMLALETRGRDIRALVATLEDWVIATLAEFGLRGERRPGRIGIWVERPALGREDKIAAIGLRVRRWISYHGLSINVDPDLRHFDGIVPCGIRDHGVTSLTDLGLPVGMADLDVALRRTCPFLLTHPPDNAALLPVEPARPGR